MKKKNVLALVCASLLLTGCAFSEDDEVIEEVAVEEVSSEDEDLEEEVQEKEQEEEPPVKEDYYYIGDSGIPLLGKNQSAEGLDLYFKSDGDVDSKAEDIYVGELTLVNGKNEDTVSVCVNFFSGNDCTRMVTKDNREYLYLEADSSNDYYDLIVFDITDGKAKFVDEMWETYVYIDELDTSSPDFSDSNNILLGDISEGFGTFYYYNYYTVGPDGTPEPKEEAGKVYRVCSEKITSKKALEFETVDSNGNPTGVNTTVPTGSVYVPIRTDGKSWVDAEISDGNVVRIRVNDFGYDATINGEYVRDLFDGLMFVG